MACASTFEANLKLRRVPAPASESNARRGPQSLPPMPRCTTLRYWLRALTSSTNLAKRFRSVCTASLTGAGGTGARKAVCQAARFSVQLMAAPSNKSRRYCSNPCCASNARDASVSATEFRCVVRSIERSAAEMMRSASGFKGLLSTACENCFQAGLFDREDIGLSVDKETPTCSVKLKRQLRRGGKR